MGGIERVRHVIEYYAREPFVSFHDRHHRWAVLLAHRRAGKTVATINDKIHRAVVSPLSHARYAYVAPFLAQAKEVAWEYLKRYAMPVTIAKSEAELWIEFCLLYTSPSPRDGLLSRMPSSA